MTKNLSDCYGCQQIVRCRLIWAQRPKCFGKSSARLLQGLSFHNLSILKAFDWWYHTVIYYTIMLVLAGKTDLWKNSSHSVSETRLMRQWKWKKSLFAVFFVFLKKVLKHELAYISVHKFSDLLLKRYPISCLTTDRIHTHNSESTCAVVLAAATVWASPWIPWWKSRLRNTKMRHSSSLHVLLTTWPRSYWFDRVLYSVQWNMQFIWAGAISWPRFRQDPHSFPSVMLWKLTLSST